MTSHPIGRDTRRASPLRAALWCAFALSAGSALAAESRIELRDGSVVSGDLIGIGNGVYRVRSSALGEIAIPESQVLSLRPATAGAAASTSAAASIGAAASTAQASRQTADLAAIQQQLLGKPETMEAIGRLQSDPDIQAALADPEFTRLIMSGNVEALRTDPRTLRLMENPAIKAIVGQTLGR